MNRWNKTGLPAYESPKLIVWSCKPPSIRGDSGPEDPEFPHDPNPIDPEL